jgi:hypothetical protein
MPRSIYTNRQEPDDQLPTITQLGTTHLPPRHQGPDISQLATTRLPPHQPPMTLPPWYQIAQHVAEMRRLTEIAGAIEQAITALIVRLHMVTDIRVYEALEHNRADLQRYKDELESVVMEHVRAVERLEQWQ